jgi:hypothetical protein
MLGLDMRSHCSGIRGQPFSPDHPNLAKMLLLADDCPYGLGKTDTRIDPGRGKSVGTTGMGVLRVAMSGTWKRVGDSRFVLDPKIEVEVYRWHAPGQQEPFFVEFQSPKEYPHRRFYPIEVLEALKRNEPAYDYVDRMCRLGISMLPEMESAKREEMLTTPGGEELYTGKVIPSPETLEFLLAIFESRRDGHQRVTRDFHGVDDFFATNGSRRKDEFLVLGIDPPKGPRKSQDIIDYVAAMLSDSAAPPASQADLELPLVLSPMRTALDQVLVEGVLRKGDIGKTPTINDIACKIAPALIDSIDLDKDSQFLVDHLDEFRYFLGRLGKKYLSDRAGFPRWLRQERQKGFLRLLPNDKTMSKIDQKAASDKGKRFFRRVLWSSYEAMSRCFGAAGLQMWVSFFQSDQTCPSQDEQRAFRCYHAPLVFTAGMPLWFFGPNVLRWVMDGFIDKVWGWKEAQDFDSLTDLIFLYGQTARQRRDVDTRKKRIKKVIQNRPDLHAGAQSVQYEETPNGQEFACPTRTVPPEEVSADDEAKFPEFPSSKACPCSGRLIRTGGDKPTLTRSWILIDTECAACSHIQTYRIRRPSN